MSFFSSLFYLAREAKFNPIVVAHTFTYTATATYIKVVKKRSGIESERLRNWFVNRYHGKVLIPEDAERIIKIGRDISLRDLEQVIPYTRARDIVLKNPSNIVAYECT